MNTTQKLEFDKKILLNFEWWEITGKAWVLAIEKSNDTIKSNTIKVNTYENIDEMNKI